VSTGLLLLRESSVPLHVYSSDAVRRALSEHYPVLTMLDRYCGVTWTDVESDATIVLDGSSLEVTAFPTGGDPPLYVPGNGNRPASLGLTIRDRESGKVLTYAPALASIDGAIAERFDASDCVLLDGTFWTNDELVSLGIATRDAHAMGHVALTGANGTLAALSALRARKILVHVNNTNPILLDDSSERATVEAGGFEVAYDGMEIAL
jgi:pyrroloquinoline quinone biosynthesis protein B